MTLEQLLEVAGLFTVIGACIGWLIATSHYKIVRSFDRLLPPRYLKTAALRRRPAGSIGEEEKQ
ncbi:cellulose biosynthesis protein BcsF [Pseudomonas sp. KSR10]|uniref:Cellulose biosynthesis protein BcsF n=1 Tax=Stutzerimonas stutzeri TaxID=316 RepID=A0A0D9AF53_STUST|nr:MULTISPECIES: cellulose biosynthesis protein BcsF [Pseudomonadaceae]KJH79668.1 hypothetical protein UF78_21185 [Stutzerimonas stutzeri]MCG6541289.1 cellulose biosynthesis protein BcsF [Pseudomonas sp. KSR10]